ncbi:MAG: hypothetical protein ACFFB2_16110 [Promethearchaeota archaeon]
MSIENQKRSSLPLVLPTLIGIAIMLVGVMGLFSLGDIFYQILSGFLIIPGSLILYYSIREFRNRRVGKLIIKHDERSEKNRLKAADLGFRFLFISLLILILFNAMNLINEIIFVAITGPVISIGITLYYLGYYWFEQRG